MMKVCVGCFINYDDMIVKEIFGDGFGEIRKLWRIYYGKEYRICGCWDCEVLILVIEKVLFEVEFEMIVIWVEMDVRFYWIVELR